MAEAHNVLSTQTWAWDPLLGASAAIMIIITSSKHLLSPVLLGEKTDAAG